MLSSDYLEIRSVSQQIWRYPIEKTQFSVAGEWDDGCALEVRSLCYFRGEGPHELATPPEQRGPLFQFTRPITRDAIARQGVIQGLQLHDARFEAIAVPFPAGVSFGSCHLGVRQMSYSLTWLRDLDFQCRVDGSLQQIHHDPLGLDGAAFKLEVQLPFDGVWIESADPAEKEELNRLYDSLFGSLGLTKQFDEFLDAVVLRAHR